MKRTAYILFIAMLCCTCSAQWQRFMPSALGDARLGRSLVTNTPNLTVVGGLHIPRGEHSAVTFTGWYKFDHAVYGTNMVLFPLVSYTPGPIQFSNPDLLDDAGGHTGAGFALSGARVFTNVVFSGYPLQAITNQWPRGVYTVDGESDESITVSVGGSEINLGPGAWNRNVVAGPEDNVTVSGTGHVRIGISKTPCREFFQASAIPAEVGGGEGKEPFLAMSCSITNAVFNFWSIRIALNTSNHYYSCLNIRHDGSISQFTRANTLPVAGEHALTDSGIYQLLMVGVINATNKLDTYFDDRANSGWLTDLELQRIRDNGLQEINRRGL